MMSERLKVLLLVNDLRMGGAERQLVELAKGINKERFTVLVVTLYPGQPLEAELIGREGVRLISLNRAGKYDFSTLAKLWRLLRQERVHIIQPFLTPATFFGITAAMLAGAPIKIVTERCGLRSNERLGTSLYRFIEDRLTRYADVVVPNSQSGCEYVIRRGISRQKTRVIYNGVNPERLACSDEEMQQVRAALATPAGGSVVGIVASLAEAKDHQTLLNAAAAVSQAAPGTRFAIVGDGELRPQLEEIVRRLHIADKVVFFGSQPRVASYIASFDIAVLSSRDLEGCSNFLLEAMGMGKPAVATDVGGNGELVQHGETGLLVPTQDAQAMAQAILSLVKDPDTAKRMGSRAREYFNSRFTLERMVTDYESLYVSLWNNWQRKHVLHPANVGVSR